MRFHGGRGAAPAFAALVALASLTVAGCASHGTSVAASSSATDGAVATAADAGRPVELTGASFVADGETPRLLLSGSGSLSPTVYTRDDGKRVVIDLSNASPLQGLEPPRVPPGPHGVSQVTVRSFTELGRPHVQIELASEFALDPSIGTEPGSSALAVKLARKPGSVSEPAVETVAALPAPAVVVAENVPAPAPAPSPAAVPDPPVAPSPVALSTEADKQGFVKVEAAGKPASRLTSIDARNRGPEAVDITITGDGAFGYEAFLLANPPRYVVDLTGVKNGAQKTHEVGSGPVNKVRVSQFRGQPEPVTRIVFDLREAIAPQVASTGKGLKVTFAPQAQVASVPRSGSFESREFEEPAAAKVAPAAEPAKAAPAATLAESSQVKPEPAVVVEPAVTVSTVTVSTPPAAAEARVAQQTEPVTPPKPAEAPAVASQASAPKAPEAVQATIETAPATVAAPAPAEPAAPAAQAVEHTAPVAPAAEPVSRPAEIKTAAKPEQPPVVSPKPEVPSPRKPVRSSEDRALMEAAEALINQQDAPKSSRDLSNPYEARVMGSAEKQYTGEPITLNLKDADVKDTLQKFSDLTGLNIVLDPDVRGTVTVSLTDIPWDQALELILKINGLGYVLEGNVMRIAPTGKLANEEAEKQRLIKAQEQNRPTRTIIQKLSYARGGALQSLIKQVMTPRGDVLFDNRSNSLIIKELAENLPVVLDLIRNLDTPPMQVMIEARIVEAKRNFSESLGISWNFVGQANNNFGNSTGLVFPNSGSVRGGVALPAGPELIGVSLANVLDSFRLNMALSAAESRGLAKIISSPKIQAAQGTMASIQSGTQVPIQTTVNNTTSVLYVDATTRLDVTPFITAEGTVMMEIAIQRREPLSGINIAGGGNVPLSTRDARTQLLVRDGGTAVIGGIMKLTTNSQRNMVPGLWKIPLLGNLFKNRADAEETDELMIFITPRIMKMS